MKNNYVKLIGKIDEDFSIERTKDLEKFCRFSLLVKEQTFHEPKRYYDVKHKIIAWRQLADFCDNKLNKGQKIELIGKLKKRSYKDKNKEWRQIYQIEAEKISLN